MSHGATFDQDISNAPRAARDLKVDPDALIGAPTLRNGSRKSISHAMGWLADLLTNRTRMKDSFVGETRGNPAGSCGDLREKVAAVNRIPSPSSHLESSLFDELRD